MSLFYYYFYAHTSPIHPPPLPPRIDSAPAEWEEHHLTELCYHRAAKKQRQRLLPPPAPLPGGDTAQPIGPAQLLRAKPHPWHFPGTRGGAGWSESSLFPPFPSPRGGARCCQRRCGEGDGKRWCCRGRGGCAARGTGRAGFTCSGHGGEGTAEENRISVARKAWDLLTCGAEGRGRGDCGSGAAAQPSVRGRGQGRGDGRGPGARRKPRGAGDTLRHCGRQGRPGHAVRRGQRAPRRQRGDTAAAPRGKLGWWGDLPVPPASLPSSRLLSLTHPLHGFQDQSQFIAGHLRAGSGGRSGARGGEEGAAARPERRSRGGQEEEEKEDEEGASRRCGGSFPRGSRGSDARAGRGGAA